MDALVIQDAWLKEWKAKVGHGVVRVVFCCQLTPAVARDLKVFSTVFEQDGTPKQTYEEVKLTPRLSGFNLKMQHKDIPLDLSLPSCSEADEFLARRKGSTKKGKASKLILQFRVTYKGSKLHLVEWEEKYGTQACQLVITPTTEQGDLFAVATTETKKGKRGRTANVQPIAPAADRAATVQ